MAVGQALDVPTVTVKGGDTLYGIALANRVPMRALIVLNKLEPPYRLSPGQQLILPPQARLHTVVQGDTSYSIARRYGVTVAELAELNALDPPGRILLGQQLVIPGVELQQRLAVPPEQTTAVAVTTERAIEAEPLPPVGPTPPAETQPVSTDPSGTRTAAVTTPEPAKPAPADPVPADPAQAEPAKKTEPAKSRSAAPFMMRSTAGCCRATAPRRAASRTTA